MSFGPYPVLRGGTSWPDLLKRFLFGISLKRSKVPLSFFQCAEIRKKNIFADDPSVFTDKCPCLIKVVIQEAEELVRERLRSKSLRWLHDQVHSNFPDDKKNAIKNWIKTVM